MRLHPMVTSHYLGFPYVNRYDCCWQSFSTFHILLHLPNHSQVGCCCCCNFKPSGPTSVCMCTSTSLPASWLGWEWMLLGCVPLEYSFNHLFAVVEKFSSGSFAVVDRLTSQLDTQLPARRGRKEGKQVCGPYARVVAGEKEMASYPTPICMMLIFKWTVKVNIVADGNF